MLCAKKGEKFCRGRYSVVRLESGETERWAIQL